MGGNAEGPNGQGGGLGPRAKSGPDGGEGKAAAAKRLPIGPILLAVLLLVGLGFLAWRLSPPAPGPAPSPEQTAQTGIGGPFHLLDQDGRPVDQHVLDGKWSAVFFGYTYCPDTCPATLQALGAASRKLGNPKDLQVVFISVDPDRDTPKQMKTYLESQGFPAHALGLTGTPAQVAEAAKAYSVYYAKSGSGSDYTMDHSAAIYLMDPKGRFTRPLTHEMAPDLIAGQIKDAEAQDRS
jgi:protein SCO1/2